MGWDERVQAFLDRPLEGEWPYLWLDATYLKVREGGRIGAVAAIIAVAVDTDGRREIVGLGLGPSEAETFWSSFLKGLVRRGLPPRPPGRVRFAGRIDGLLAIDGCEARRLRCPRGSRARCREGPGQHLAAVSRALGGLLAAVPVGTDRQLCCRWMRNALAHVPKGQHTMVAAALRQPFLQPDLETACQTWRQVADQLRSRWPKLGNLADESEHDVLAYMAFPTQHRAKLHSTDEMDKRLRL